MAETTIICTVPIEVTGLDDAIAGGQSLEQLLEQLEQQGTAAGSALSQSLGGVDLSPLSSGASDASSALDSLGQSGEQAGSSLQALAGGEVASGLTDIDTGAQAAASSLDQLGSSSDQTVSALTQITGGDIAAAFGDIDTGAVQSAAALDQLSTSGDAAGQALELLTGGDAAAGLAGLASSADQAGAALQRLDTGGSGLADVAAQAQDAEGALAGEGAALSENAGHAEEAAAAHSHFSEVAGVLGGVLAEQGAPLGELAERFSQMGEGVKKFAEEAESGGHGLQLLTAGLTGVEALVVGKAVEGFTELGDSVHEMAETTGASLQTVQGLGYAMQTIGDSAEAAQRPLMLLERNAGTLSATLEAGKEPTGRFAAALEQLGISAQSFVAMNPDERIRAIFDAFAGKSDEINKTQVAMDLFGRSGASMIGIMEQGSSAIDNGIAKVDQYGAAITDADWSGKLQPFHTAVANLSTAWQGFEHELSGAAIPLVTGVVDKIAGAVGVFDKLPGPVKETAAGLVLLGTGGLAAVTTLGAIAPAAERGIAMLTGLAGARGVEAGAAVAEAVADDAATVAIEGAAVASEGFMAALGPIGLLIAGGAVAMGALAMVFSDSGDKAAASAPKIDAAKQQLDAYKQSGISTTEALGAQQQKVVETTAAYQDNQAALSAWHTANDGEIFTLEHLGTKTGETMDRLGALGDEQRKLERGTTDSKQAMLDAASAYNTLAAAQQQQDVQNKLSTEGVRRATEAFNEHWTALTQDERTAATWSGQIAAAVAGVAGAYTNLSLTTQSLGDAAAQSQPLVGAIHDVESAADLATRALEGTLTAALNLFTKPTSEEVQLSARMADNTKQVADLNLKLADTTGPETHIAELRKTYDASVRAGGSYADQEKALGNLNQAIATSHSPRAQEISDTQGQLDAAQAYGKVLQAQATDYQATRADLAANTKARTDDSKSMADQQQASDDVTRALDTNRQANSNLGQVLADRKGQDRDAAESLKLWGDSASQAADSVESAAPQIASSLDIPVNKARDAHAQWDAQMQGLPTAVDMARDSVQASATGIGGALDIPVNKAREVHSQWDEAMSGMGSDTQAAASDVQTGADAMSTAAGTAAGKVRDVHSAWNTEFMGMGADAKTAADTVGTATQTMSSDLDGAGKSAQSAGDTASHSFDGVPGAVESAIAPVPGIVQSTFASAGSGAAGEGESIGEAFGTGIAAGIAAVSAQVQAAAAAVVTLAVGAARAAAGNPQSPAPVTIPLGRSMAEGVEAGWDDGAAEVGAAARRAVDTGLHAAQAQVTVDKPQLEGALGGLFTVDSTGQTLGGGKGSGLGAAALAAGWQQAAPTIEGILGNLGQAEAALTAAQQQQQGLQAQAAELSAQSAYKAWSDAIAQYGAGSLQAEQAGISYQQAIASANVSAAQTSEQAWKKVFDHWKSMADDQVKTAQDNLRAIQGERGGNLDLQKIAGVDDTQSRTGGVDSGTLDQDVNNVAGTQAAANNAVQVWQQAYAKLEALQAAYHTAKQAGEKDDQLAVRQSAIDAQQTAVDSARDSADQRISENKRATGQMGSDNQAFQQEQQQRNQLISTSDKSRFDALTADSAQAYRNIAQAETNAIGVTDPAWLRSNDAYIRGQQARVSANGAATQTIISNSQLEAQGEQQRYQLSSSVDDQIYNHHRDTNNQIAALQIELNSTTDGAQRAALQNQINLLSQGDGAYAQTMRAAESETATTLAQIQADYQGHELRISQLRQMEVDDPASKALYDQMIKFEQDAETLDNHRTDAAIQNLHRLSDAQDDAHHQEMARLQAQQKQQSSAGSGGSSGGGGGGGGEGAFTGRLVPNDPNNPVSGGAHFTGMTVFASGPSGDQLSQIIADMNGPRTAVLIERALTAAGFTQTQIDSPEAKAIAGRDAGNFSALLAEMHALVTAPTAQEQQTAHAAAIAAADQARRPLVASGGPDTQWAQGLLTAAQSYASSLGEGSRKGEGQAYLLSIEDWLKAHGYQVNTQNTVANASPDAFATQIGSAVGSALGGMTRSITIHLGDGHQQTVESRMFGDQQLRV